MMLQNGLADCGPAALFNALCVLGQHRSMDELRDLCRMTASDGTSERKMRRAVDLLKEACGLNPWVIQEKRKAAATGLLHLAVRRGRPVICGVDNDDHWVVLIGMAGERFLVADSANTDVVQSLDGDAWLARWDCGTRWPFWGLVL